MSASSLANQPENPTAPKLAFSHLNLCWNPFGDPELNQRPQLAVLDDLDDWAAQLKEPGTAFQFIGDKGRGKTTRLLALHSRFPNTTYVRVGPERNERPTITPSDPLFIDEFQNLPKRLRKRLLTPERSYVIGTHIDHTSEFKRIGLKTITIEPADAVTPALLARMFERRIEWARRDVGQVPRLKNDTIDALYLKYGSDVRAMEYELYDVFQNLTEPGDV